MKRVDLELAIRAAGAIVKHDELLVIGSQSILGTFTENELPPEATFSREADIAPLVDDGPETLATAIDVHLGEWSDFDDVNGFYVQGVSRNTAVLPPGWRERLVPLRGGERTVTIGLCLEPHDLCAAKLARNEPKDREFVAALVTHGLVDLETIRSRVAAITDRRLSEAQRVAAVNFLAFLQGKPRH